LTRWYATGTDIDDRVRAEQRTRNENMALREQIDRDSMFEDIVGSSDALRQVLRRVSKVASSLLKQEKEMIEAALATSQGRISGPSGAAAKLGLLSRTLDSKIKRLKINVYRFKTPH
jgi:transcriptional regulator with GAF, ATPase, and Fis domain